MSELKKVFSGYNESVLGGWCQAHPDLDFDLIRCVKARLPFLKETNLLGDPSVDIGNACIVDYKKCAQTLNAKAPWYWWRRIEMDRIDIARIICFQPTKTSCLVGKRLHLRDRIF